MMNVSATYGNSYAPAQPVLASVTDSKENTSPQEIASETNQTRSQETAQAVRETQTQERVAAKDQPQASTTTKSNDAYNEYQRTGKLDTYA
ncbi:MAG: hypothetical protein K0U21_05705 [Proteobacteria bacterium]|nr:hypothetical protein [Pseudomonadota bacterium]